ncbi:hypothetical protein PSA5_31275 [Pseudomonas syringae pv. actinidiae]|nr:hypothetical protein PSA5_31275 [Pseudomonas syringae pv. actinidiae]
MIQFLLNQELKTERSLNPNMTVLTYLREQAHKPGTKEAAPAVTVAPARWSSASCTATQTASNSCAIAASIHA